MALVQGAWVVITYIGVLWLPGLALAYALRARGWMLVGTAPLITYGAVGVVGPSLSLAGIPWSAATFLLGTLLLGLVASYLLARARRLNPRGLVPIEPGWSGAAHAAVAGVLAVSAVAGGAAIARAMSGMAAVPQDWDAVFHANGIRFIAESGDGGLYGMSEVNWFEPGTELFYPNAYHLLGAVVYQLTGAPVTSVLNAHTLLIPGLTALSIVVLVRRMGGRAVLAGSAAVVVVSLSALYDMLWRGPLLPYGTGVALTPLVVVLLLDLVDAVNRRDLVRSGLLFAIGLAGLVCLQPASLLSAILFTVPPLAQRWWSRPRLLVRDVPVVLVAGAGAAALTSLQLLAGLGSSGDLAAQDWPADLTTNEALGQLLTFSHAAPFPQMWIIAGFVAGVLTYRRLGDLRWIGAVAATFGLLFIVAASSDEAWANSITQFWWNDRWRLVPLAAIAMAVIAGHGLAETQRWITSAVGDALRRLRAPSPSPSRPLAVAGRAAVAAVVLVTFALGSNGLYVDRNTERMSSSYGRGPALTPAEVTGMRVLADIVPPGGRVLNDRGDGSSWMYALTGLRPVAGHYNGVSLGPDTALLANKFNDYPDNPAVRAAVDRLGIDYVFLSNSFLRPWADREPGLVSLHDEPWLERVYRNSDVVIYRIRPGVPDQELDG